eukprot:Nk52_evm6s2377 gene=Nk52_evmTU6s2377
MTGSSRAATAGERVCRGVEEWLEKENGGEEGGVEWSVRVLKEEVEKEGVEEEAEEEEEEEEYVLIPGKEEKSRRRSGEEEKEEGVKCLACSVVVGGWWIWVRKERQRRKRRGTGEEEGEWCVRMLIDRGERPDPESTVRRFAEFVRSVMEKRASQSSGRVSPPATKESTTQRQRSVWVEEELQRILSEATTNSNNTTNNALLQLVWTLSRLEEQGGKEEDTVQDRLDVDLALVQLWVAVWRGRVEQAVAVEYGEVLGRVRACVGDGRVVLGGGRVVPGDGTGTGEEDGVVGRVVAGAIRDVMKTVTESVVQSRMVAMALVHGTERQEEEEEEQGRVSAADSDCLQVTEELRKLVISKTSHNTTKRSSSSPHDVASATSSSVLGFELDLCAKDGTASAGATNTARLFEEVSRLGLDRLQMVVMGSNGAASGLQEEHGSVGERILLPAFRRCMSLVQVRLLGAVTSSGNAREFKDAHRSEFLRIARRAVVRGWVCLCQVYHALWVWRRTMQQSLGQAPSSSGPYAPPCPAGQVNDGRDADIHIGEKLGECFQGVADRDGAGENEEHDELRFEDREDDDMNEGSSNTARRETAGSDELVMDCIDIDGETHQEQVMRAAVSVSGNLHKELVDELKPCAADMRLFGDEARRVLVDFCEKNFVGGHSLFGKILAETELRKLNPSWRLKKQVDAFYETISFQDVAVMYAQLYGGCQSPETYTRMESFEMVFCTIMDGVDTKQRAAGRLDMD